MERDGFFVDSSGFAMEAQSGELNPDQNLPNCFFDPNSLISADQNDPFESALSSIVSSPAASHCPAGGGGGEGVLLRELIGRLGSICNSGEISPESYLRSANTSCYSTPMSSPPKLNLMEKKNPNFDFNFNFAGTLIPADPGFAERAARYSCFGGGKLGQNDAGSAYGPAPPPRAVSGKDSLRVAGAQPAAKPSSPENGELGGSREGSSVSEQIPAGHNRKRKSIPRGKAREGPSVSAKDTKIVAGNDNEESKPKKSKQEAATESDKNGGNQKQNKDSDLKPPEPPKDYIHVRARRGQATDSHSLAERVRREKISERMKFLQDLVPGCNKVTGKAVMLDEIINYVQSLQRQVEFLSMKLSTVNPRMDFNMETLLSKEALQSCGSLPQGVYPLDSSVPTFPYGFHPQQLVNASNGSSMALPRGDGFGETSAPPQVPGFWEDDLQSLVQMGFCPNQPQPQNSHGSQMKLEL